MQRAFEVPAVDLSPYTGSGSAASRVATAAEIDRACREVGFVQVVGHGVAAAVTDGLAEAMDRFFALPAEEKLRWRAAPSVNRGYSPPRSEALSLSLGIAPAAGSYDLFEAFNVGRAASEFPGLDLPHDHYPENLWPDRLPGFRHGVEAYFAEAGRVARALTAAFADALGLPAGFFSSFTDHSVDVLRMNHYALPGGTPLDASVRGMGEHTDYGIVTVLWADRVPGLEVLDRDGCWHGVVAEPGALLVNLGDLTARWTNDRWRSTLHRVVPPVVAGRVVRRRSAAYFHDGNVDARIETLRSCRARDGSSAYEPTTVGEHLAEKLAGSRAGRANHAAGNEAARALAATPALVGEG